MNLRVRTGASRTSGQTAFTLVEVAISLAIIGIVMTGVIIGFVQSTKRAEWSAYSLAAQSLAIQRMEQARSAKWDPFGSPPADLLVASNFPVSVAILDVPMSGTNLVRATNTTKIIDIKTDPPLRMIYVECVWRFLDRGIFTNSIATYRATDQ